MLRNGITEDTAKVESETHEVDGDTWSVSMDATRIKSLEQLVEHCSVDLNLWEVDRFVCNKWEVGAKNDAGRIAVEPLFQVKAWFKKRPGMAFATEEIESLKADAKRHAPKYKAIVYKNTPTGNIAEIAIPDIHIGKLAWGRETMDEDYDTRKAIALFREAMLGLMSRVSFLSLDRIVLVIGNDLVQIDNRNGTTTAGTVVDRDSRYHKIYKKVRQMLVEEIDKLRMIAPVLVVVVPGNHDNQTAFTLGDSLECWFHNCSEVEIQNEPTPRKYYQHGKVMIMWCHGDKAKRADYPLLMATEKPAMFGVTVYRECHTGHLHTTRTDEKLGVRVRIIPSLCPADYWHAENGFTGNIKAAEIYVWNEEEGLVNQGFFNISHRSNKN
jgi:hypothetical protein